MEVYGGNNEGKMVSVKVGAETGKIRDNSYGRYIIDSILNKTLTIRLYG
jgi:hypothetical protein